MVGQSRTTRDLGKSMIDPNCVLHSLHLSVCQSKLARVLTFLSILVPQANKRRLEILPEEEDSDAPSLPSPGPVNRSGHFTPIREMR